MKPIDAITGLPRSPDIARVVAREGRQGEVHAQTQAIGFAKEMDQRSHKVPKTAEIAGDKVSPDAGGEGGPYQSGNRRDGDRRKKKAPEALAHPTKGKIVDIRGA